MTKPLLDVLNGKSVKSSPIWMMRQAGRHLPEYLELRAKSENFIEFCMTPERAAEATLQPIRRYAMDGAILFADILLIPMGLGRKVDFIKGIGPVLEPIKPSDISALKLKGCADRLSNIYQTVSLVKAALDDKTTLIGFAGGPWTVATYMIEGRGSPSKEVAKRFAYQHPEAMADLLSILARASADYLIEQAKAGADVLKIFESWAEGLSPFQFENYVIKPTQQIITRIRAAGITCPIMGFPRAAGLNAIKYAHDTGISAMAIGTDTSIAAMRERLPKNMPLQGNLDPLLLRMGGEALMAGVDRVLEDGKGGPHIFNLGHGVSPDVKIESVQAVVNRVRGIA
ncbi:MAG: uroporphyrinogen decarboxylase [Robiginitomaculum sp.]